MLYISGYMIPAFLKPKKLIHNTNIIMITTRSAVLTIAPTGLYIITVTTTTATTATV